MTEYVSMNHPYEMSDTSSSGVLTCSVISWRSVLLVEETGVRGVILYFNIHKVQICKICCRLDMLECSVLIRTLYCFQSESSTPR
jgi:hypothetical protein